MTAHSIFTECDVLIKAGVCVCARVCLCALKCLCSCAKGMNDSKQFCCWTDLHFKHLNAHAQTNTHIRHTNRCMRIHTYPRTQTQTQSHLFSSWGWVRDRSTKWMIEITVTGGHVTAPSGRCMYFWLFTPMCVCVSIVLCFCLFKDRFKF